jgi:hypothetical protein
MKHLRPSVMTLMIAVGVAAVALGMGKALWDSGPWSVAGVAPAAVVFPTALFFAKRCRGKARAFWAGFALAGTLAETSYLWGATYGQTLYVYRRLGSGGMGWVSNVPPSIGTGGRFQPLWNAIRTAWTWYGESVQTWLMQLFPDRLIHRFLGWSMNPGPFDISLGAAILFAPQLLIALLGGMVGLAAAWALERRQRGRAASAVERRDCDATRLRPAI